MYLRISVFDEHFVSTFLSLENVIGNVEIIITMPMTLNISSFLSMDWALKRDSNRLKGIYMFEFE